MVRMAWNHHSPAQAFWLETLMTLAIPLIIPAAIIPGSKGMKILAILCKKRCRGLSYLAFCWALLVLAT